MTTLTPQMIDKAMNRLGWPPSRPEAPFFLTIHPLRLAALAIVAEQPSKRLRLWWWATRNRRGWQEIHAARAMLAAAKPTFVQEAP